MKRTSELLRAAAATLLLAMSATAAADKDPVYTGLFSSTALKGYDAVAYFTEGEPVRGDKDYAHEWNGATWLFSSAAHRDAFIADPERYAPQYGGYCAWAVSQGYTASGDPKVWAIVDGRLYVNYDEKIGRRWQQDTAGFIERADANWPRVLED